MTKDITKSLKLLQIRAISILLSILIRTTTIVASSFVLILIAISIFITGHTVAEAPSTLGYFFSYEGLEWAGYIGTALILLCMGLAVMASIWQFSIKKFWRDSSSKRIFEWATAYTNI